MDTLEEALAQVSRKASKVLDDDEECRWSVKDAKATRIIVTELETMWRLYFELGNYFSTRASARKG